MVSGEEQQARRKRAVSAAAAAAGTFAGGLIHGPIGAAAGAAVTPYLELPIRQIWAELSSSARCRMQTTLEAAIVGGIPPDELSDRISASERTKLLTWSALEGATHTAWEDKLHTLGQSLALGLLASDVAKIDAEQMIMNAIADIEGPHLCLLDLLARHDPRYFDYEQRDGEPLNIPFRTSDLPFEPPPHIRSDGWDPWPREWPVHLIEKARPQLRPVLSSLLGTLQRHGLVTENNHTDEAIEIFAQSLGRKMRRPPTRLGVQLRTGNLPFPEDREVSEIIRNIRPADWSPTELGELVCIRFYETGANIPDAWNQGHESSQEPNPGESVG
jgi:hypothetical protein